MSDIKTWIERCDEHPDHQSGMISDGMIRARMCEEIADLRAEIERLLQAIGLVTTTVPDMEIDIENPVGMAQRVVAEVERLRAGNEKLREALSWYADQRNHFPVEHRRPGDPDPAVVFVEEPPIMSDGGKRARKALWGKP
jgi:hypothetical protein